MMRSFLISLLAAQVFAASLSSNVYSSSDCTGSTTLSQSIGGLTADGTCQEKTENGNTVYYSAPTDCSTISIYPSGCSSTAVTYDSDVCTTVPGVGSAKYTVDCGGGGSDPCFADTTTACRLNDAAVPPSIAFQQCFGEEASTLTERVPMKALAAGDIVLASPTAATRVIVNQHAAVKTYSNMVTLEHETGTLSLTADHVIYADGEFKAAGQVSVGSILEPASKVTKIANSAEGIINPLTASGTILAAGPTGAPVISSAVSEWIADLVLESSFSPLAYSLSSIAAYLFPHQVQAFYDAHLEQFFTTTSDTLKSVKAVVPAPVALAILAMFDLACVCGLAAWALFSLKGAIAVVAVAAVAKSRRVAKA